MDAFAVLVDRVSNLAARLDDPNVADAGLELNALVLELRGFTSSKLYDNAALIASAVESLGPTGFRVASWLGRHPVAETAAEELLRSRFWNSLSRDLAAVSG